MINIFVKSTKGELSEADMSQQTINNIKCHNLWISDVFENNLTTKSISELLSFDYS